MAGLKQFTHFVGYVVDREDGQNLGRVKVKALGFHDPDSKVICADDLPWAPVVDGTYGAVSTVPLIGDWVLGAFLDGADAQHPIVLGCIPGYNSQLLLVRKQTVPKLLNTQMILIYSASFLYILY